MQPDLMMKTELRDVLDGYRCLPPDARYDLRKTHLAIFEADRPRKRAHLSDDKTVAKMGTQISNVGHPARASICFTFNSLSGISLLLWRGLLIQLFQFLLHHHLLLVFAQFGKQ
jgi:hypothetical protein